MRCHESSEAVLWFWLVLHRRVDCRAKGSRVHYRTRAADGRGNALSADCEVWFGELASLNPMRQRIIEQMDKGERHPKKMSLVSLSQDTISLLNFASKKPLNPWEELLFDLRGR
jgi:hypothetical protein